MLCYEEGEEIEGEGEDGLIRLVRDTTQPIRGRRGRVVLVRFHIFTGGIVN